MRANFLGNGSPVKSPNFAPKIEAALGGENPAPPTYKFTYSHRKGSTVYVYGYAETVC